MTGAALCSGAICRSGRIPPCSRPAAAGTDLAAPETIVATLEREFPGYRFSGFDYPGDRRGTFLAYVAKGDELRTLFLDAASGAVIGELPHDGWIQRLQELHFTFQAGQPGYVYNGIAASCLLVMCVTGVVVWWPGLFPSAAGVRRPPRSRLATRLCGSCMAPPRSGASCC